jgi:predicted dienelactone hydrolase
MEKKSKSKVFWKNPMWNKINPSILYMVFFLSCTTDKIESQEDTSNNIDTSSSQQSLDPFDQIGSFRIGHKQIEHTYEPLENRPERTIVIDVWYPTLDSTGEIGTYIYGVDEDVLENATLASSIHDNGYPVHLHSHGYQGWGATSAFLMRYFASHGWIAIAPNHTNNLLADHEDPLPTEHFIHRPLDLTQSLNVVAEHDFFTESDPNLQMDNVLMSGHSFGASYSTWGLAGADYERIEDSCGTGAGLEQGSCTDQELTMLTSGTLSDHRIKAAIPLAGTIRKAFFGDVGYKSVQGPVLFISGTEDNHQSAQDHFDEVVDIDFSWLSLEGGCHQSFALGQCSTLDVETGFEIVQTYSLAFARKHILNVENEDIDLLLTGMQQPWAQGILQKK